MTLDHVPESPKGKTRYGACDHAGGQIIIDWCLPETQTVRVLIHEITHGVLHPWPDGKKPEHWDETLRSREIQAETAAFAVCRHYGLDTSAYSIPYIAGWARKLSVPEIEADIDIALRTAQDLITTIDAEILKRRPADQTRHATSRHWDHARRTRRAHALASLPFRLRIFRVKTKTANGPSRHSTCRP